MQLNVGGRIWKLEFHHHCGLETVDQTVCFLTSPTGKVYKGEAFCHWKDQYCKCTGRKVAFWRVLQGFQKHERAAFWEAYFQTMPKDKKKRR